MQQPSETLDEYLQSLRILSKKCNFKAVSATVCCDVCIRDAFISGLTSPQIRQRLLENNMLDLETMFEQARSLETGARSNESYSGGPPYNAAIPTSHTESRQPPVSCPELTSEQITPLYAAVSQHPIPGSTCYFCGNRRHFRSRCPARNATCLKCQKRGHYAKICHGNAATNTSAAVLEPAKLASILAGTPDCLKSSSTTVSINGMQLDALFDSGSSESFIHPRVVREAKLPIFPSSNLVSMAASSLSTVIQGYCVVDLVYRGKLYNGLRVSVLQDLCADLILGLDFQSRHESITFQYGGPEPPIAVCGLSTLNLRALSAI